MRLDLFQKHFSGATILATPKVFRVFFLQHKEYPRHNKDSVICWLSADALRAWYVAHQIDISDCVIEEYQIAEENYYPFTRHFGSFNPAKAMLIRRLPTNV